MLCLCWKQINEIITTNEIHFVWLIDWLIGVQHMIWKQYTILWHTTQDWLIGINLCQSDFSMLTRQHKIPNNIKHNIPVMISIVNNQINSLHKYKFEENGSLLKWLKLFLSLTSDGVLSSSSAIVFCLLESSALNISQRSPSITF